MSTGTHFSEAQWALIKPLLPLPNKMGRPRANDRQTLEAILWIDRTGAPWQDLPAAYGDEQAANRRLHKWQKAGYGKLAGKRVCEF